jgi:hypothetical protein
LARERWKGRRGGGARGGEALGSGVGSTGLRLVCGHRLGTLRRERLDCTSELLIKPSDGAIARFVTRISRLAPQTLRRGVNSRCRERFFAKNFIGHVGRPIVGLRGLARGWFRRAGHGGQLCALAAERTRSGCRVNWIWSRASGSTVGCEVAFDQPARQQSIAAFIHPDLKKLLDFLAQVRGEIQSRALVRLQSRFRRIQKKLPIHFLPSVLGHGDILLMDGVRYPFINTGQEKRALQSLWIFVQKSDGYCAVGTAGTGVSARGNSRLMRDDQP